MMISPEEHRKNDNNLEIKKDKDIFTLEQAPWIEYLEIDENTRERKLRDDTPKEILQKYNNFIEKKEENKILERNDKNLIIKVIEENWGLKGPFDRESKEWRIYSNFNVEHVIKYRDLKETKEVINCYKISDNELKEILSNIELAKLNVIKVDGCDGVAWEFIQYEENKEIWKRNLGYIYGINPLEKII